MWDLVFKILTKKSKTDKFKLDSDWPSDMGIK